MKKENESYYLEFRVQGGNEGPEKNLENGSYYDGLYIGDYYKDPFLHS